MFRNNLNSSPLSALHNIKQTLSEHRDHYINLLNENRQMIESIDICIDEYEMQINSQLNSPTLTNEEVLRFTSAHHYGEIVDPLNDRCYLSGVTFSSNDWVCKLPCGHIFDGPSICYHLTRINSLCPSCNRDVISEQPRNIRQIRPQQSLRPRTSQTQQSSSHHTPTNIFSQRNQLNLDRPRNMNRNMNVNHNNINNFQNSSNLPRLFDESFPTFFSTMTNSILETNANVFDNLNLLTQEEIENATEEIFYEEIENPTIERCPISYIEFESNSNVTQIKHCKHIFDTNCLNEWLMRKNTCPVCRYDLKTYGTPNNNATNNNATNNNATNNNTTNNNATNNNATNNNATNNNATNNNATNNNATNNNLIIAYDSSGNAIYGRNGYATYYYFIR
jgi:hypothetical protein